MKKEINKLNYGNLKQQNKIRKQKHNSLNKSKVKSVVV